jgi:anaerobic selenocysteine-containing dehydrogenase
VRTGYSAIADEWIPIRPGTDGALFMALLHELIRTDQSTTPSSSASPMRRNWWCWTKASARACSPSTPPPARPATAATRTTSWCGTSKPRHGVNAYPEGIADGCDPALEGHYTLADGTRVAPSFQLLRDRVADNCTPEWAADHRHPRRPHPPAGRELGQPRSAGLRTAHPLDRRLGQAAPTTQARPVAFHAMRGLAAHSNGFQTVRALAVLMSVLGTIDAPGGFRHKAPYPRHIVPNYRAFNDPA